jgi:alpha-tubulin suppressor-like RCC1 family protein
MGLPNGSASLSGLFSSSLARHALAIDGSGNLWAWGPERVNSTETFF